MKLSELGLKPADIFTVGQALQATTWIGMGNRNTEARSPTDAWVREPDLVITPDGKPYLYRWHVIPRNEKGNVYLHIQVADDPERPLHDHPWDNVSVILAGGYLEHFVLDPRGGYELGGEDGLLVRVPGETVFRRAESAHRLLLRPRTRYSISLFSTGPVRRDWGFWVDRGARWMSHQDCIRNNPDGTSVYAGPAS